MYGIIVEVCMSGFDTHLRKEELPFLLNSAFDEDFNSYPLENAADQSEGLLSINDSLENLNDLNVSSIPSESNPLEDEEVNSLHFDVEYDGLVDLLNENNVAGVKEGSPFEFNTDINDLNFVIGSSEIFSKSLKEANGPIMESGSVDFLTYLEEVGISYLKSSPKALIRINLFSTELIRYDLTKISPHLFSC